jgi:hypothetical protein
VNKSGTRRSQNIAHPAKIDTFGPSAHASLSGNTCVKEARRYRCRVKCVPSGFLVDRNPTLTPSKCICSRINKNKKKRDIKMNNWLPVVLQAEPTHSHIQCHESRIPCAAMASVGISSSIKMEFGSVPVAFRMYSGRVAGRS